MTDTMDIVVRIVAVRYAGLLEFATLVVHNTQGMDACIAADSFNNARPCWRK